MRLGLVATFAAVLLTGSRTRAEEEWLVPRTPVIGTLEEARDVPVSLFSGDGFVATEEETWSATGTTRVVLLHGGEPVASPRGTDGPLPFARLRLPAVGGYLFVVDRTPLTREVPAKRFEDFLAREGQDAALAERAKRSESGAPGRETVTRFLKAFVEVASWGDESFDRTAGQTLELLPGNDPVHMRLGHTLQMLLQYRGKPLAGARVFALSRVQDDVASAAYTTDGHGMVFVRIDRPGLWLVRAAHVERCEGCTGADWNTTETTYVFESGGPDHETFVAPRMRPAPAKAWIVRVLAWVVFALVATGVLGWRRWNAIAHRR
jgi:hypothetical protein